MIPNLILCNSIPGLLKVNPKPDYSTVQFSNLRYYSGINSGNSLQIRRMESICNYRENRFIPVTLQQDYTRLFRKSINNLTPEAVPICPVMIGALKGRTCNIEMNPWIINKFFEELACRKWPPPSRAPNFSYRQSLT